MTVPSMRLDLLTRALMLTAWPRLALVRRGRRWIGQRRSSGCVSGPRLHRGGAGLRGCLLGGCSLLRGFLAKRCGRISTLFRLASSTAGRREGPSFGYVLSWMLEPRPHSEDDSFSACLTRCADFLALTASNKGMGVGMAGRSAKATRTV